MIIMMKNIVIIVIIKFVIIMIGTEISDLLSRYCFGIYLTTKGGICIIRICDWICEKGSYTHIQFFNFDKTQLSL